ncbi:MAG: UDP-2,4-diacetamido-2,4, 6-trideoxy-beta-L-altropyranose hydrolase [Verrucomicrobia bacterium]|jgi:UDP-2,4-diacetamido-2,4,6-trideoxy-beta-L-altropyranose hydrolase|nr:UDP-2,4-diacetamido-2,4, 6-trideoxy-beta-L-altropyranose hydrolase [Verrucomicrobiota bacterium]
MTPTTLIIRADASSQMGTGHVMRCLALAEPWLAAGTEVILAAQLMPEALGERVLKAGIKPHSIGAEAGGIEDAQQVAALVSRHRDAWLVVDGYQFGEGYFSVLKQSGAKVLQIDDFGGLKHYETDFVLNQNLGVTAEWYPQKNEKTRLLLGTRYVQLRREFLEQDKDVGTGWEPPNQILVTLGGSDPDNVTAKVISALQEVPSINAAVVIGGSNPHWDSLLSSVQLSASNIHLIRNAKNMPELMAQTSLAIAAGGTTAWEFAYMGVPMMTIVLADNQRSNGEQLAAAGVAVNLGWHEDLIPEVLAKQVKELVMDWQKLDEMSAKARKLVDGRGSMRVWLRLNEDSLRLRSATAEDAKLIFDWANDAGVRAVSFSSEPIIWEDHLNWFNAKLSDANYRIWVAEDVKGTPIGQVRFQIEGETATISISLDAGQRGKNRGSLLIWAACRKIFAETAVNQVRAYIKPDNQASERAFEKAGFEEWDETTVKGAPAWVCSIGRGRAAD